MIDCESPRDQPVNCDGPANGCVHNWHDSTTKKHYMIIRSLSDLPRSINKTSREDWEMDPVRKHCVPPFTPSEVAPRLASSLCHDMTVMTFPDGTFTPLNSCCLFLLITGSWKSIKPLMNKITSYCAHCNLMRLLTHSSWGPFHYAQPLFLQAFTKTKATCLFGSVFRFVCHGWYMV